MLNVKVSNAFKHKTQAFYSALDTIWTIIQTYSLLLMRKLIFLEPFWIEISIEMVAFYLISK